MVDSSPLNVEQHTAPSSQATVGNVLYKSEGKVLLVCAPEKFEDLIEQLSLNVQDCTLLQDVVSSDHPYIIGHLGSFRVFASAEDAKPIASFDLVVDNGAQAIFEQEVLPFGYCRVSDESPIEEVRQHLAELVGEFEKPRYFRYEASLCAHKRRGIAGCHKCVDACSAGAALSFANGIKVNPWLCQGCASCTAACPSGALRFNWPSSADILQQLNQLLEDATIDGILFHTHRSEEILVNKSGWAQVSLHEVNAIGPEFLLYLIARGLRSIIIERPLHARSIAVYDDNAQWLSPLVHYISGQTLNNIVVLYNPEDGLESLQTMLDQSLSRRAEALVEPVEVQTFSAANGAHESEKRWLMRYSVLAGQKTGADAPIELSVGAPFGNIVVDKRACTLCMSCVNVCPPMALVDGGEEPQLNFDEQRCLQCGLCATACPEDAITLTPRFEPTTQRKPQRIVINEAEKFACIRCGTDFATAQMIDNILAAIGDNPFFRTEEERNRLRMCGDCRVIDMMEHEMAAKSTDSNDPRKPH